MLDKGGKYSFQRIILCLSVKYYYLVLLWWLSFYTLFSGEVNFGSFYTSTGHTVGK